MSTLALANYRKTILFILLLHLHQDIVNCRKLYARFIVHLEELERFELSILKSLAQSIISTDSLTVRSDIMHSVELYLKDFYESTGFSQSTDLLAQTISETNASKHPLCSYRLIRRVKFLLQDLVWHKSFHQQFGNLWRRIILYFWRNGWPTYDDLETGIEKILRLHHTYDFDTELYANGLLPEIRTNCTLSSLHCYEISQTALKTEQYALAIKWLELAKKKAPVDKKIAPHIVEFSLWNAIEKHNLELDEDIKLDLEPVFFDRKISHSPGDSNLAGTTRNLQYQAFKGKQHHDQINFLGLCSGDNQQSEKAKSQLICWYESKMHPSLILGPRKMEFVAMDPDVVKVYDIIYDEEIDAIISNSSSMMHESRIVKWGFEFASNRAKSHRAYSFSARTGVNTWFPDGADTALAKRIEGVTGLVVAKTTSAEALQVASYSSGGHNYPHMDQMGHNPQSHGQHRIATFMFYLNDVDQGGATAFTSMGVAVKPSKGSALFWYNVFSNGVADWTTMHGACPVLLGAKWVANKWIKLNDQFLVRKCGLNPTDRFQIPVNGASSGNNRHSIRRTSFALQY